VRLPGHSNGRFIAGCFSGGHRWLSWVTAGIADRWPRVRIRHLRHCCLKVRSELAIQPTCKNILLVALFRSTSSVEFPLFSAFLLARRSGLYVQHAGEGCVCSNMSWVSVEVLRGDNRVKWFIRSVWSGRTRRVEERTLWCRTTWWHD